MNYKCGHSSSVIIMNESIIGISAWLCWKDSVGFDGDKSQCWDCYNKELDEKIKASQNRRKGNDTI